MPSSIERVFAITERFDQIMLHDCISVERLFILQRVSQHFNRAISASFYLQGKMRVRYLTDQEQSESANGSPWFEATALPIGSIDIRPYRVMGQNAVDLMGGDQRLWVRIELNKDMVEYCHVAGNIVGRKGKARVHDLGSWTRMKLTDVPVDARIEVAVRIAYPTGIIPLTPTSLSSVQSKAISSIFFQILREIMGRSRAEHQALAYAAPLTTRSFGTARDTTCLQSTPQERVFAIPELLEQILLCVGGNKLFALQRVDSQFKAVINTSSCLGAAMGLRHLSDTQARKFASTIESTDLFDEVDTGGFHSRQVIGHVAGGPAVTMVKYTFTPGERYAPVLDSPAGFAKTNRFNQQTSQQTS